MKKLDLVHVRISKLREQIRDCQKKDHIQQVVYSTFHDSLTQVCFTCGRVRTELNPKDIK